MITAGTTQTAQAKLKKWLLPGILGIVALAAGIAMPHILASGEPASLARPVNEQEASLARPVNEQQVPSATNEKLTYTPPAWPDAPDSTAMLLRLGWGTAVVLVVCVGSLWLLKRFVRGKSIGAVGGGQLRIVESLAINNRCSVYLLGAGNHQILAGIDASGLKALVALPSASRPR